MKRGKWQGLGGRLTEKTVFDTSGPCPGLEGGRQEAHTRGNKNVGGGTCCRGGPSKTHGPPPVQGSARNLLKKKKDKPCEVPRKPENGNNQILSQKVLNATVRRKKRGPKKHCWPNVLPKPTQAGDEGWRAVLGLKKQGGGGEGNAGQGKRQGPCSSGVKL